MTERESREGGVKPEEVLMAENVIKEYAEANSGTRILRPGRTQELQLAEAVVMFYERSKRALDATLEKILTATDDQISATLRQEGHDPKDVATIAKQAAEIAMLKVDLTARSTRSENVPLEETDDSVGDWQCRDYGDSWITFPDRKAAEKYQEQTGAMMRYRRLYPNVVTK